MDVRISKCIHCDKTIRYEEAKPLPKGGGVCFPCGTDYAECDECHSYFLPEGQETICDFCTERLFAEFI